MVSGFIVFVLVARLLGAEALGQYAFVMAFVMVAGGIAEFGTTAALAKDLPRVSAGSAGDSGVYFGNYLLLRLLLAAVVVVVALVIAQYLDPQLRTLLWIACAAVPLVGARFCEIVFQVYNRPIYTVYASVSLAILQLTITGVLLFVFNVGLQGYFFGFLGVQLFYFVLSLGLAVKLLKPRFLPDASLLTSIAVLSLPMGVWAFFNIIGSRADVFILTHFHGSHEVGIYNSAYRLVDLAVALAISVTAPLVPLLSSKFHADKGMARDDCMTALELSLVCLLPIPLFLPQISQFVVILLFGEAYSAAAPLLDIFSFVFLVLGVTYISMSINLAAGNITHTWWNGMLLAVVNIALNLALVPRWGALGSAYAVLASMGLHLLVSLYYTRVNIGGLIPPARMARVLLALVLPTAILMAGGEFARFAIPLAAAVYLGGIVVLGLLPLHYAKEFRRA